MKKPMIGSGRVFGAVLALVCAFTAAACDDSDDGGGGAGGTGGAAGAAAGAGGSAGAGGGAAGAGGGAAGAGGTAGTGGAGGAAALKDIVDTAVAAGSFTKLAAALGAADLATALKGAGPFTVFAPTDAAFDKLPAGTVETLLKPENKAQLQSILKYHVVSGKVPAATAVTLSHATTLEEKDIAITASGNTVRINDATVTMADVQASNGVIHVIDTVLIPPTKDIVETAQGISTFSTLVAAVTAAELAATLKGTGPFTVFAPTNDAFAKLPAGTVDNLLKPENKAMLQAVLKYHVLAGKKYAGDVVKLTSAATVQGPNVTIAVTGTTVKVNTATVTATNVLATNGVIHVIDTVLLPPSM